ncbi:hypothetical protein ACWCRD_41050 [Streptomyces sp. NPDC002092]
MGGEREDGISSVSLKNALLRVETGWSPVCEPRLPAEDEWGVLKLSAVTSGAYAASEAKALPAQTAPRAWYEVQPGDVLMSRANGVKALVGVACTVRETRQQLLLPDLVFRLLADPDVLDQEFLGLVLGTAAVRRQIDDAMRGSSGQYKISKTDVQGLRVPRLELEEQRRIVAAHAVFERRIAGLERVRRKSQETERATLMAMVHRAASSEHLQLGELLTDIETGWSPACDTRPPSGDEWGVVKVSAITSGRFEPLESKRLPAGLTPRPRIEVREGDVLVARANGARALVGAVCQAGPTRRKLMLSDKILRLVPDATKVDGAFLPVLLRSDSVRQQIENLLNGGTGQNNISQADIRALRVPCVGLDEQRQIIATQSAWQCRFDTVGKQIDKLRMVQQAVVEDLLGIRRLPLIDHGAGLVEQGS